MSGLAALSTGVFVALLVGLLSGGLPTLQRTTGPRGPSRLAVQLQQAGVGWTPLQVRVATAVGALLTMVVVAVVTGIPAMAVVPGVLVLAAPQALLRRRALARVRAVREAWPDALAMIGGSVRSGRSLSHAVVDVSLDGPVALRGPMAGLAARIQTVGMVPALQAVADAVGDPVTDRVVEVLCLAHAEGGRIVTDVVADLAMSIGAEVQAGEEIDTLSLEGKLNARLVLALPWVVLVVLTARPGPFAEFYAGPGGATVIGIGAVVSLLGVALVSRLSRVPDEPRVLRPELPG
ncbi:Flp pilus assembly protein TadB [Euzebya pacifica]|uniref:Flp pilus assembly protein TadB n=1 Tax=Euzebya pacifica TaxID=1608957 RepID=A0A346Y506_9ACTN|nr:hypothetical protein [Euzebya pacifica]AXV09553.1 Flp pilus assembly protein TadB [Euzebya pacifica]